MSERTLVSWALVPCTPAWRKQIQPLLLIGLLCGLLSGLTACTTTTRSVNESPRDPQVQRQSDAQSPSTTSRPSRTQRAQRLTGAQMDSLTQSEVDTLLTRDQTSAQQVAIVFGQPHAITRSGDELYWNYTHQFRDERRNVGGLKSLTILFDEHGRVLDYDFQDNSFNLP